MAENMNDMPVTRDMHEDYLRDPTSTHGMPYSSKQEASNASTKGVMWLYDAKGKGRVFSAAELAGGIPDGWYDSTTIVKEPEKEAETPIVESDEVKALRSELDAHGIKYDKRFGKDKLMKLLAEAE